MSRTLLITNCRRYDAPADAPLVDVVVRDGVIARLAPHVPDVRGVERLDDRRDAERVDAGGRVLAPGFIDLHVHGAGGADTLDGTPEAARTMSRTLARLGATSFLATTVMRPADGHAHLRALAAAVGASSGGARLLGVHLEGPFLNVEKRGGLPPSGIYAPSRAAAAEIDALTAGTLRMMTIAPEVRGSLAVVDRLTAAGVVAAFGHSDATYDEARAGIAAGIAHVTHLFNAMPSLHHRAPGPLVAVAEAEHVTAELICDGVHVDSHVVGFARRIFGAERCVPITDGMRSVGLPDGPFRYNGRDAETRGGTARYVDGTLIGTSIGIAESARRFREYTGCTLAEAVNAVTRTPARVLGIDHRTGTLDVGKDADLVVLSEELEPWLTVVGGTVAWRAEPPAPPEQLT